MKEQIQRLRSEGKTYNEIVSIVGCAKSSVAYHCSEKIRQSFREYRNKNRRKSVRDLKVAAGGKCIVCGYDKCFRNLSFHHKDPTTKVGLVSTMAYENGKAAATEEAKKCVLLCANCHGELHDGLIEL